jgi:23S rRNA (adenine2503-C2)-methyltransferase
LASSSARENSSPEGGRVRRLTPDDLRRWLEERGEPAYRFAQISSWLYGRGARSFDAMSNLSRELRAALADEFALPALVAERVDHSRDGTRKLLFRLGDGRVVESVIIPDPPRLTLCISSQAGCAMGCAFCATARLGLLRHLTPDEIVGQVLGAQEHFAAHEQLTNIVFMGMGEPLHNYDGVVAAVGVLTAPWGCGISGRRITVSTVGLVPQMRRLMAETGVNLAVSLTAPTDEQRDQLVPLNRKYPVAALLDACRELPIPHRRRITFEYVLLAGVNDSLVDANRLVHLLRGIRCKVNLIPFNPFPGSGFERPTDETVEAFRRHLDAAHVHATVRHSRGRDVAAACGQLAGAAASGEAADARG